ncbi:MAG: hypothetical protein ACKVPY_09550 [Paracoccaceae bacterium]
MINRKTVVVVGAGASSDLGLPLGAALKSEVANLATRRDDGIWLHLNSAMFHYFEPNRDIGEKALLHFSDFGSQLRSAYSIDNFLDQRRDDHILLAVGKMLIAYVIAGAEKNSGLAVEREFDVIENNQDYFLFDLMNIVSRGHQANNIHKSLQNLTFVTFNYDRCIERFLKIWLETNFGMKAGDVVPRDNIVHAYGSLGDYFDQSVHNPFEYRGRVAFQNVHLELRNYVDKIKIFTEQEDSSVFGVIHQKLTDCDTIVFLGFGFEEQNMRFFENVSGSKNVFATMYGQSKENSNYLDGYLSQMFACKPGGYYSVDDKAAQMFRRCYHPITRAVGSL